MADTRIAKGILANQTLREHTEGELRRLAASRDRTTLDHASFFKGSLSNIIFVGFTFSNCVFARSRFEKVSFRKCRFVKVDLTRTEFVNCYISDCIFEDCDPYYASFDKTEVHPSQFKRCYKRPEDWNKALLLFSDLKRNLQSMGNERESRAAEYYFRVWERRRMYIRWRHKQLSDAFPWLKSLFIGALVGYGERPGYLAFWIFGLISVMAKGYMKWFPFAVTSHNPRYLDYWYYSFRIFCSRGFEEQVASITLLAFQISEFVVGLILISLLIGSVTRKLSA